MKQKILTLLLSIVTSSIFCSASGSQSDGTYSNLTVAPVDSESGYFVLRSHNTGNEFINSGVFEYGDEITITSIPADGFVFARWMDDADWKDKDLRIKANRKFTKSNKDEALSALFYFEPESNADWYGVNNDEFIKFSLNDYAAKVARATNSLSDVKGGDYDGENWIFIEDATVNYFEFEGRLKDGEDILGQSGRIEKYSKTYIYDATDMTIDFLKGDIYAVAGSKLYKITKLEPKEIATFKLDKVETPIYAIAINADSKMYALGRDASKQAVLYTVNISGEDANLTIVGNAKNGGKIGGAVVDGAQALAFDLSTGELFWGADDYLRIIDINKMKSFAVGDLGQKEGKQGTIKSLHCLTQMVEVGVTVAQGQESWGTATVGETSTTGKKNQYVFEDYLPGETVTITATAKEGYHFDHWEIDGDKKHTEYKPATLDFEAEEIIYIAYFAEGEGSESTFHFISVVSNDNGKGRVTGSGNYEYGSTVILTATAEQGYQFNGWSDGNTDNPRQIIVTSDATYIANFDTQMCTVSVLSNNENMGVASGSGIYSYGTELSVEATPAEGYQFIYWSDGNTDNPRQVIVTSDATYIANFYAMCTVSVLSNNENMGVASGSGIYSYGTELSIEATPEEGYQFIYWSDGNTDNPRQVIVTSDASYMAIFTDVWGTCGDNLTWGLTDGVLTISGTGTMTNFDWGDAPWYEYREDIASLTIGNSVTSIGNGAFDNCSGLTSVTIGKSVTSIGNGAFNGCSNLTSVIWNAKKCVNSGNFGSQVETFTFGDEVESIPDGCCREMNKLSSVTIPNSVTNIEDGAFYNCTSLTSVTIGNSVTSIGKYAFEYCSGLTSIEIPYNVTSIGSYAFYHCSYITSVIWNAWDCNSYNFGSQVESFTFGNAVGVIPDNICKGMYKLTSIIIPDNVYSIGKSAFEGCSNLRKVYIGTSVQELKDIGDGTFADCSKIDTVIWNAINCADMEYSPFYYSCENIKKFIIADDIKRIPANLCWGVKCVTSLRVPETVTAIGKDAFYGSGLKELYIPNSVKSVGGRAFQNCPLQKIEWNVPEQEDYYYIEESDYYDNGVKQIVVSLNASNLDWNTVNLYAWDSRGKQPLGEWPGTKLKKDKNGCYTYSFNGSSYSSINIIWNNGTDQTVDITNVEEPTIYELTSNSGKTIYYTASPYLTSRNSPFTGVTKTTEMIFGNSVKHIPARLCTGMSELTEIIIPNDVEKIGRSAFENCSGVEELTLGNSVSFIDENSFKNCIHIADINSYAASRPEIQSNTFENVSRKAYVWVPADQIRKYETDAYWGEFFIKTKEADATATTELQVNPSNNTVEVIWPAVENAATYELVIKDKEGNLICTLVFNAQGQLTTIAFNAPARNNASQQTQSTGFSFTVTGLESGTRYDLTMTAKDGNGSTLQENTMSFRTTGDQAIDEISTANSQLSTKIVRNGQFFILRDGELYNAQGARVE